MENDSVLVSKVKEEINKLKLEIIEKIDKLDELVEAIDNQNNNT